MKIHQSYILSTTCIIPFQKTTNNNIHFSYKKKTKNTIHQMHSSNIIKTSSKNETKYREKSPQRKKNRIRKRVRRRRLVKIMIKTKGHAKERSRKRKEMREVSRAYDKKKISLIKGGEIVKNSKLCIRAKCENGKSVPLESLYRWYSTLLDRASTPTYDFFALTIIEEGHLRIRHDEKHRDETLFYVSYIVAGNLGSFMDKYMDFTG